MTIEQLLAAQQAIVDAARAAHRDMTADETAEFNDLQRQIEAQRAASQGAAKANNSESGAGEDPEAIRAAAIAAERQRTAEINALCRDFNMDGAEFISGGQTVEQVRAAVLERLKKNGAPAGLGVVKDEGDKFREAAADALRIRGGISGDKPVEGARELAGMSLRDLAIECMSREGRSTGELLRMNGDMLYTELCRSFYNPTAAFPAILDSSIKKTIVEEYEKTRTTFQVWTTKGALPDFKTTSDKEYILGGIGDFEKVPENGELKNSTVSSDVLPQRKLDTYGKQFSMTRQAFINDDIGFITKVPGMYAAAAKRTIDKQVYTMLYNNGAIYDGKTIFNADHKNLITSGAKPSQTTIQEAILQMQKQTDPFGEPITMVPMYLVVPTGYEFDLAVIFRSAQVTGSSNNDINPLYNYPLTVVQSPVLNALAGAGACPWFLVSDPYSAKFIQVDYLNGNEAPIVRRMENPGTLGFVWDIYLDWGITVRDYRGAVKNPGAVIPVS